MTEHAELVVDGTALEVRSVEGEERLSTLYRYRAEARAPLTDPTAWVGAEATLVLRDGHDGTRTIGGVVAELESLAHDDGTLIVALVITPTAHGLTLGQGCRTFIEQDVRQIVSRVLGGVDHRWELSSSYRVRPYTVQYREDDWTFISRLLEEEGIYYWFDHAADSQLVLSDASSAAPDLVGGALIPFHVDAGLTAGAEVIVELGGHAEMAPAVFTLRSFDPDNPALEVGASTGGPGLEYYDAPGGGPATPAECARQASLAAEATAAAAAGVAGRAPSARITPGRVLEVAGHPVSGFDARYLVVSSRVRVVQRHREGDGDGVSFSVLFRAIPASASFRPPRCTAPAQQAGLQSGVVVGPPGEEIHSDPSGRVRVRLHWDREGGEGWWMRVAQRGAAGSLQVPRIGWNVLTFNEEGAAAAPNVLARIVDAAHPPPYALPANKTRVVFKTATSPDDGSFNEIYFEDQKGAEQMYIHASRDMDVLVQKMKTEEVRNDQLRAIGHDHDLTVGENRTDVVRGNQTLTIGADDVFEAGADRGVSVTSNASLSIAGSRSLEVGESQTIAVEGSRSLSVGSALIDTSLGDITASGVVLSSLVGGVDVKIAAQAVTQQSGGVSLFTVGGAKLQFTQDSRPLDVGKHYFETVGGLLKLKTDGIFTDGATATSHWQAGASLDGSAPEVFVKANTKIEIVCGSSRITLTPDSVTVKAKNLDLGGASEIQLKTKKIEHN